MVTFDFLLFGEVFLWCDLPWLCNRIVYKAFKKTKKSINKACQKKFDLRNQIMQPFIALCNVLLSR